MASPAPAPSALSLRGAVALSGRFPVLAGVDLEVAAGETVLVDGPNGAGKTTTLKAITGLLPLHRGSVSVLGQPTTGCGAWELVQRGLVMVPEGRGVFTRMSILENLHMGAYLRRDARRQRPLHSC